jgi:hypothetical protein
MDDQASGAPLRETMYRVTWEDGTHSLYSRPQLRELDPYRDQHIVKLERFDDAQWTFQAGDSVLTGRDDQWRSVTLAVIEGTQQVDIGHTISQETTSFSRSNDNAGEGSAMSTRPHELADRVRDLFSRSRGRGIDL